MELTPHLTAGLQLLGHCSCSAKCPRWYRIGVQGWFLLTAWSWLLDLLLLPSLVALHKGWRQNGLPRACSIRISLGRKDERCCWIEKIMNCCEKLQISCTAHWNENYFQFKKQQQPRNLLYTCYRGTGLAAWPGADFVTALRIISLVPLHCQQSDGNQPYSCCFCSASHECSRYSKQVHQDRHIYFVAQKTTWTAFTWKDITVYCFLLSLINHRDIINKTWICSRM